MIRINLLPVKVSKRQEAVRSELMLAAAVMALTCVVLLGVHVALSARANSVEAQNEALRREITEKQAILDEVEAMEKLRAELEKKLAVIAVLESSKSGPVMMLDQLSQATPEKLQILTLDEKAGVVSLTGIAVSNEVISQFLSNLEKSPRFTDIYLNAIDQVEESGVKLKNFSITARLTSGKVAVVATEGAGGPGTPAAAGAPAPGDPAAPPPPADPAAPAPPAGDAPPAPPAGDAEG
jgi:type IV pilus assembly protein PilN